MSRPRTLITGSAGAFATEFRKYAQDRYDFVCMDKIPTPGVPGALIGDLSDPAFMEKACEGCQAVAHLGAAARANSEFMSQVLPSNILGTYNLLEACVKKGVKKVVFASTVQVEGWKEGEILTTDQAPIAPNYYAASKVFGEHLGSIYSKRHGLSFIGLRFGWVDTDRDRASMRSSARGMRICVTIRDLSEIMIRALDVPGVPYAILPAYSKNAESVRDLSPLKQILGYQPQDDSFALYGPPTGPQPKPAS